MGRRVRRWAIALGLAVAGDAAAQPWPAVPAAQPDPDPVYIIRTAGQTDRTVRVVRPPSEADPMAEVKDTVSGDTFSIPGKVLAKLPKVAGGGRTETAAELKPPLPDLPKHLPPASQLPKVEATATPPVPSLTHPTEKMKTTWRADDPPAPAPTPPVAKPLPVATLQPLPTTTIPPVPAVADRWKASTSPSAVVAPTQPPSAPAVKLTPVPTWRAGSSVQGSPAANDPWRSSDGK